MSPKSAWASGLVPAHGRMSRCPALVRAITSSSRRARQDVVDTRSGIRAQFSSDTAATQVKVNEGDPHPRRDRREGQREVDSNRRLPSPWIALVTSTECFAAVSRAARIRTAKWRKRTASALSGSTSTCGRASCQFGRLGWTSSASLPRATTPAARRAVPRRGRGIPKAAHRGAGCRSRSSRAGDASLSVGWLLGDDEGARGVRPSGLDGSPHLPPVGPGKGLPSPMAKRPHEKLPRV